MKSQISFANGTCFIYRLFEVGLGVCARKLLRIYLENGIQVTASNILIIWTKMLLAFISVFIIFFVKLALAVFVWIWTRVCILYAWRISGGSTSFIKFSAFLKDLDELTCVLGIYKKTERAAIWSVPTSERQWAVKKYWRVQCKYRIAQSKERSLVKML